MDSCKYMAFRLKYLPALFSTVSKKVALGSIALTILQDAELIGFWVPLAHLGEWHETEGEVSMSELRSDLTGQLDRLKGTDILFVTVHGQRRSALVSPRFMAWLPLPILMERVR